MIPLSKKNNAVNCSDFRIISLICYLSKNLLKVLTKGIDSIGVIRIHDIPRRKFNIILFKEGEGRGETKRRKRRGMRGKGGEEREGREERVGEERGGREGKGGEGRLDNMLET